MNYIKHLNAVFQQFSVDSRLNATHISLYMSLFQFWNIHRFPAEFYISREEVMSLAKIGGTATYHKCMKNLNDWKYLCYMPSYNPFKGSKIKMFIFETSSEQVLNKSKTSSEQALIHKTNINKQIENINKTKLPKNVKEVLDFFEKEKWPAIEAEKFFNHYTSIGWKVGGKIKIVDWQATAKNWMLKAEEINSAQTANEISKNAVQKKLKERDNLKTTKIKDYGQPL